MEALLGVGAAEAAVAETDCAVHITAGQLHELWVISQQPSALGNLMLLTAVVALAQRMMRCATRGARRGFRVISQQLFAPCNMVLMANIADVTPAD